MAAPDVMSSMNDLSHESVAQNLPFDFDDFQKFYRPLPTPSPYPVSQNPVYSREEFANWSREWLLGLKVDEVLNEKMFRMLLDMEIHYFASVTIPLADEWGLKWLCKLFYCLWIVDDMVDATAVGRTTEAALSILVDFHLVMMWSYPDDPVLKAGLAPFLDAIPTPSERQQKMEFIEKVVAQGRSQPGTVYAGEISIPCEVFRHVFAEAYVRSNRNSVLRLCHTTQEWLSGVADETAIRENKRTLASMDEAMAIRRKASAGFTTMAATDIVFGLATPNELYYSEPMQKMLTAANDYVGVLNDMWSVRKEVIMDKDSCVNLILVICSLRKVTHMEAAKISCEILGDSLQRLNQAAAELERTVSPELRPNFLAHKGHAETFASGDWDWNQKSVRYNSC